MSVLGLFSCHVSGREPGYLDKTGHKKQHKPGFLAYWPGCRSENGYFFPGLSRIIRKRGMVFRIQGKHKDLFKQKKI
jgi:hypothetical protein